MVLSCSKKLSAFLRGITSKHHGTFYCLNCIHSFAIENKLELQDFFKKVMPSEDTKIFNQYEKSDEASFIIYADLECIIAEIDGCKNNPEKLSTTKVSEHISSGFSMSSIA